MSKPIGRTAWAIAEGYIPPASTGTTREMTSHETVCILNAADRDAHVEIMVYFADRDPAGPYKFTVGARRTRHLRFNDFKDPQPVPVNTDFSSVIVPPTCPSWCSTRASTAARRSWRCCPPWPFRSARALP